MLKVFAGYDSRVPQGFEVFRHSVERHASGPVQVIALDQDKLRQRKWYWRKQDAQASTPFSLTRFLVPALCGYESDALFFDGSDMLITQDVFGLLDESPDTRGDGPYAVACVQHDYNPNPSTKFLGQAQHAYPRKNWSSVMWFNCDQCLALSPRAVNTMSPSDLHQFAWCGEVGSLPLEWNWLAGEDEYRWDKKTPPALIHYTLGLPVLPGATKTEFDDLWYAERQMMVDSLMLGPSLDHAA